jgi:hypothetical protein
MVIPTHCGLPPLTQNIEGLRSHSLLVGIFMPEPEASPEMRKWRSWLVHCLAKAARHYNEARGLILAQIAQRQRSAVEMQQGLQLPIFDFSFAMEDCVTSLYKVSECIQQLEHKGSMPKGLFLALAVEREELRKLRNHQEHLQNKLAAGETGPGPILMTLDEDGGGMKLGRRRLSFAAVHSLVDAAYRDIAGLFQSFPVDSAVSGAGVPTLSITATIEVIGPDGQRKRIA